VRVSAGTVHYPKLTSSIWLLVVGSGGDIYLDTFDILGVTFLGVLDSFYPP
jgi:hypothetical protein